MECSIKIYISCLGTCTFLVSLYHLIVEQAMKILNNPEQSEAIMMEEVSTTSSVKIVYVQVEELCCM
jgi:hypothetical protein